MKHVGKEESASDGIETIQPRHGAFDEDDLPLCYRTHPGSIADITTLHNMVSGLKAMGCKVSEIILDRGFFSAGNIAMLAERKMGFTVPIPVRSRYFST